MECDIIGWGLTNGIWGWIVCDTHSISDVNEWTPTKL